MQRARPKTLKTLYFVVAAALAAIAAYLAAALPAYDAPTLQSLSDIATVLSERVTLNTAAPASGLPR